jgi:hypothetical protein
MVHSIGQNYVDVMGELWEFFDSIKEPLPFALSPSVMLRTKGLVEGLSANGWGVGGVK